MLHALSQLRLEPLAPSQRREHIMRTALQQPLRSWFSQQASAVVRPRPRSRLRPRTTVCQATEAPLEDTVQYARGECYGCGAQLQLSDPERAGYVQRERYELKARHRQLGQLLCRRCQELSNGAMIPAVADFAQQVQVQAAAPALAASAPAAQAASTSTSSTSSGQLGFEGKRLLNPEQLREQLAVVRERRALVVLLVDLLDASGSMLGRVRQLVGKNPIVLVGTKADLLPAGADAGAVANWLAAAAAAKKVSVAGVHLVSSRSGAGVPEVAAAIRQERRGRDVYVIGAANVGKSAFIRALVREMSSMSSRQYDPAAAQRGRFLPVESAMPGTTLRLIPMEVFGSGGVLYDTPGLHLHHRVPHLLSPEENKLLQPRRALSPYVAPPPASSAHSGPGGGSSSGAVSYSWGGLARLDLHDCPESTRLVFYGPQALAVAPAPSSGSGGDPDSSGSMQQEAFGAASVEARGGLRPAKQLVLRVGNSRLTALADVAVSGVPGWVTVYSSGRPGQAVRLEVWAPVGVEVWARPPLPLPSQFL